jgi:hypothetical protein
MALNTMHDAIIHRCQCPACRGSGDLPVKQLHQHVNLFLSRLDEQQRRLYAALESMKHGHGGDTLLSQITGMSVHTICRGRRELQRQLRDRPDGRIRLTGGGRPRVEKKIRPSCQT